MSFKDLIEPECGGANPLMRLGQQVARDSALRDEAGISRRPDFLPAPESFRMDVLLKEMQEMDRNYTSKPIMGPSIVEQVRSGENKDAFWPGPPKNDESMAEFWKQSLNPETNSSKSDNIWARDFWDQELPGNLQNAAPRFPEQQEARGYHPQFRHSEFFRFMDNPPQNQISYQNKDFFEDGQETAMTADFFKNVESSADKLSQPQLDIAEPAEDWAKSFEENKKADDEYTDQYNKEFWDRLQDEWKKLSEDNEQQEHPWLSEFSDYYDPYKEYKFDENNPMINIENAFEKGKKFLENGDIPSAVLCFESAVKQEPDNADVWEFLGTSQAENEKDPNAIAALKKSLELKPDNMKTLMALAISYTNESYQNQALKMLNKWLKCNPKYTHLVPINPALDSENELASSLIKGPELEETQNLFLKAVQLNASTDTMDSEVQEALGVLFNLSSEYDKAVDCFQAAVQMAPENAKLWNRLGASYANGNRATEAVGAYQKALEIEPGFIRARYNVGVVCINLKSYREAAEHLLLALTHQATSKNRAGVAVENVNSQMSDTLWSTLRMTVSLMGRHELQKSIDNRDLDTLNKEFGMNN